MYHDRITHDGLSPAPQARWAAPDIADDATLRERRQHAAGAGFAALLVVLPMLLALVYFARVQPDPVEPNANAMVTSTGGRAFTVTTWSIISILAAMGSGWVLAGAVRLKGRQGARRMLIAFIPAAVIGVIVAAAATIMGASDETRLLMSGTALLISWCAIALCLMLRATRGYGRQHERAVAIMALVLFLVCVPLSQSLWLAIPLAFIAWTILTASTQWHPRQLPSQPISDRYAEEHLAKAHPTQTEHLRFPLHRNQ